MIYPLGKIIKNYNIPIYGIIHVGAHEGQEYEEYLENGIDNMLLFEPVKSNYQMLITHVSGNKNIKCFNIGLGNKTGEERMYVDTKNGGMSSSILKPGTHLKYYPEIVFDKTEVIFIDKLDNISFDRKLFNAINIDVQGYELEVLRGAIDTLSYIDILLIELNSEEVYVGCALADEVDNFLKEYGFLRAWDNLANSPQGDSIYLRKK